MPTAGSPGLGHMAADGEPDADDHWEDGQAAVSVQAMLDEECRQAHAVSLTQATQFSAGDRVVERGRVRHVILGLPQSDVLQVCGLASSFAERALPQQVVC